MVGHKLIGFAGDSPASSGGCYASFRTFLLALAVLCTAAISTGSVAGALTSSTPTIFVSMEGEPQVWEYSLAASDTGTTWEILEGQAELLITALDFNSDPFVLNDIFITNSTSTTQVYTVGIALPTVFPAPNVISGNVSTSAIDGGDDGATVATVGGFPIYSAQIDFGTVATLQDDPFMLSAPAGETATSAASFGPLLSLIPVTSSIGIQLRFSLTSGDSASILSRFDVVAETTSIPEPSTSLLMGFGLLLLWSTTRRSFRRI